MDFPSLVRLCESYQATSVRLVENWVWQKGSGFVMPNLELWITLPDMRTIILRGCDLQDLGEKLCKLATKQ